MLRCSNHFGEVAVLKFDALVRGRIVYDGPDHQPSRVPQGRCSVEAYQGVVSLTWVEEGLVRQARLKPEAFELALEAGALQITDASQLRAMREPARAEAKG